MDQIATIIKSDASKFVFVAIGASLLTLGAQTVLTQSKQKRRRKELDQEMRRLYSDEDGENIPNYNTYETGLTANAGGDGPSLPTTNTGLLDGLGLDDKEYDDELIREQLARNYAFFGEEGMQKVRDGFVTIVGCGGVGSWAAVMLARSGLRKLRIIDFDQVTLSSLNRHATAIRADVGIPKVRSVQRFIHSVAPWCEVDTCIDLWNVENEELNNWLSGSDFVIDAIDNITTKVDLISYCHARDIRVVSSMGAGSKTDPSRIQIADISQTVYDPLSRSVRRRLRVHPKHPVHFGIPVIYSTEVPRADLALLPLPDEEFEKGNVAELGPFDDFRVRILPVLGMIPAMFGLGLATWVICGIAGKGVGVEGESGIEPLGIKGRKKYYEKLLKDLGAREMKFYKQDQQQRLPITDQDAGYIFEELHRGKSVFPPFEALSRPTLVRWRLDEPLSVLNCVVMSPKQADLHQVEFRENGRTPEDVWGEKIAKVVRARRKEAEHWLKSVM